MSQKTKLQKQRALFTQSNAFLRVSRHDAFHGKWEKYLKEIMRGRTPKLKQRSLRILAEVLVDEGYYSPNIGMPAVETMILRKLYHLSQTEGGNKWAVSGWPQFVNKVVGSSWFNTAPKTKKKED